MPLHTINDLIHGQDLQDIVKRLTASKPGLILSTGGDGSGKLTTLLALAHRLAQPDQPVVFAVEDAANLAPFRPLPDGWHALEVAPDPSGWRTALADGSIAGDAIVIVAPLQAGNVDTVLAMAPGRWLLATVETTLAGLEAADDVLLLGIDNERLLELVRMVWSQQLVDALCKHCSTPTQLESAESAYLFPNEQPPLGLRIEAGCPQCDAATNQARGTLGKEAVCEVVLIDDASRPAVRTALMDGLPLQLAPTWHIAARDQARSLLAEGVIGVDTYRALIRRNPLLRVQGAVER